MGLDFTEEGPQCCTSSLSQILLAATNRRSSWWGKAQLLRAHIIVSTTHRLFGLLPNSEKLERAAWRARMKARGQINILEEILPLKIQSSSLSIIPLTPQLYNQRQNYLNILQQPPSPSLVMVSINIYMDYSSLANPFSIYKLLRIQSNLALLWCSLGPVLGSLAPGFLSFIHSFSFFYFNAK